MSTTTISNYSAEAENLRISIITVVRNGADTLESCIQSVIGQAYRNIEFIVMDGGSTDGTPDILRRYDSKITFWNSESDSGIYDAMNKGMRHVTGERILFLGSDDTLSADLRTVAPFLIHDDTIYYGDAYWPGRQRLYDGLFTATKLARTNICHQAVFYPRAVFNKYSFNLRYSLQADWELNMRCFSDPEFRFQYIPVQIAVYNDLEGLSSVKRDLALEQDYIALMWRHFPWPIAVWRTAITLGGRFLHQLGWKGMIRDF
jgi:glycosyltransferase involved in cell wall biosynthesis